MSAHFPKAKGKILGYHPEQVDSLIANARVQFADPSQHLLDNGKLRHSAFNLVPGGYLIKAVDAALERLDDAFAVQEVQRNLAQNGRHQLDADVANLKSLLEGRTSRPKGKRFAKVKPWHRGYSKSQVDSLCVVIAQNLTGTITTDVDQLRSAEFKASWGGYAENQVDAFIDRAVELWQISKVLGG